MRRAILTGGILWLLLATPLVAIPNSFIGNGFFGPIIPAHPRFNANLTPEFLDAANWEKKAFPGPWENETALAGRSEKRMTALPVLFGSVPQSVVACEKNGELREIAITYLDAGEYFGFTFGGEKTRAEREEGDEKRAAFDQHFRKVSRDLRDRLEAGCGPGEQVVLGRSDALRTVATDYRWEDFVIRFVRREGHSVALHLMRADDPIDDYLDERVAVLDAAERQALFKTRLAANERGDLVIADIPMYEQGHTPFCGVHTLAMAGSYYGLEMRADDLAAGAEFRNTGSARGSRILDLYHAAGEELGMDVKVSSRFDFKRVAEAVEAGMPVIVWRRVSKEREEAHSRFAAHLQSEPFASLPEPTRSEKAAWPPRDKKRSPSHASIISGINPERQEVIFTDPWGEAARDRRMRAEEMEATVYAVFYFRL